MSCFKEVLMGRSSSSCDVCIEVIRSTCLCGWAPALVVYSSTSWLFLTVRRDVRRMWRASWASITSVSLSGLSTGSNEAASVTDSCVVLSG